MVRRLVVFLLVATAVAAEPATAAEPPNQNDPCSKSGRNTCGTLGEGSYRTYRYGIRWFGDYRGAVPDVRGGTFCIDLRFWYPSADFGYERRSAEGLRNKEGQAISATALRRMSRALWRYGRSDTPPQQAAVMVYVHRLMSDGAPGEADPKALTRAGQRVYARVAADAERWAGPYRVRAKLPPKLVSGRPAEVAVEVLAGSGRRVPNIDVALAITGADGAPASVNTGARGVAKATLTARDPEAGVTLEARAEGLPADMPALYVPTRGAAAENAQRIVAPATSVPRAQVKAAVKADPALSTQISAQNAAPGAAITDTVRVTGLGSQARATIQAALYGPYPTREGMTCADTPVWTGTIEATGDGEYVTAPVTLTAPGYYTYREWIVENDLVEGVETACAEVAETTVIQAAPVVTSAVSAVETAPGATVTDAVTVSGLGPVVATTVNVELWGPFPTREAIRCEGTPWWTGTVPAPHDGTYTTPPVALPDAGYYVYRESIAGTEAVAGTTAPCGGTAATTLTRATPKVSTVVSRAVVKPDAQIFDRLTVSGLGRTRATIDVDLFGPYETRAAIDCKGEPYWSGTVRATGDGTYESPKATVRRAGFYAFRERIRATETVAAAIGECGVEAETSLAAPLILGGRGDVVAEVRAAAAGPKRVRIGRLGLDAPADAVGIDTRAGALGIPADISRVGWWRDGAAPGATSGTVLIGGHVDSASAGAGAFYALRRARRGDIARLDSRRYRVTSVRRVRKTALPASLYTRSGPPKLVLVTCGGAFADGHYADNVIVTAVPA